MMSYFLGVSRPTVIWDAYESEIFQCKVPLPLIIENYFLLKLRLMIIIFRELIVVKEHCEITIQKSSENSVKFPISTKSAGLS